MPDCSAENDLVFCHGQDGEVHYIESVDVAGIKIHIIFHRLCREVDLLDAVLLHEEAAQTFNILCCIHGCNVLEPVSIFLVLFAGVCVHVIYHVL